MSLGLYIFCKIGIITTKQFLLLFFQLLLTGIYVPFSIAFSIWLLIDTFGWMSSFSLVVTMLLSFIISLILVFITFHFMNKSFLNEGLDRETISNLSALSNFLTFIVTMLLLFYSTFSSELSNITITNLEKRLNNIEIHLVKLNNPSPFVPTSNNNFAENKLWAYYYMVSAMVAYVLASYYTLLPIVSRQKISGIRKPDNEIKIQVDIIEKAEIALLLEMKHKHIQSYDQNKEKNKKIK